MNKTLRSALYFFGIPLFTASWFLFMHPAMAFLMNVFFYCFVVLPAVLWIRNYQVMRDLWSEYLDAIDGGRNQRKD
jgi:hypothetical protein